MRFRCSRLHQTITNKEKKSNDELVLISLMLYFCIYIRIYAYSSIYCEENVSISKLSEVRDKQGKYQ